MSASPSLTIFVLGCGTMGVAVLSGVLQSLESPLPHQPSASGTSTPVEYEKGDPQLGRFIATVGRPESVKRLRKTFSTLPHSVGDKVEIWAGKDNARAARESNIILVCCKPHMVADLLSEIPREDLEGKLLISICAGLTIAQIKKWVPESTVVVRAMPNTPAKIREGMTILTPYPTDTAPLPLLPNPNNFLVSIFSSTGLCRILDEKYFDACTALSGSGPAFACIVLEAMADGGVMMGLPRKEALELAAQTMQGAARMVLSGLHPAQLKDSVTTPGGCTIAGLLTLEDGKVRSTMARAIQVAATHASGLGQTKK